MQLQLDTIYNMDCLEGMKMIPDGTVDAVICDLPYGVLNSQSEGGSWDAVIPFAPLWEQYRRVCKPNAAIVLFAQGMFTADLMQSNRKMWRYNLIWDKVRTTGFLNARRMPLRSHEDIVVFYEQQPVYNPQFTKGKPNHSRGKLEGDQTNRCYGKVGRINPTYEDKKHPRSFIVKQAVHCNEGQFHPTQKPIDLLRYLVLTYTNEGDTVLDNCMGRWYNSHRVSEGASPLPGLRVEQGILRQSRATHQEGTAAVDALLNNGLNGLNGLCFATVPKQKEKTMKRFRLNICKTDNRGWLYLLPSVEYRHHVWYLWQLSVSWLRWSFTFDFIDNREVDK